MLVKFSVSPFNHDVGIYDTPRHVSPSIIVAICSLPPRRLKVTTSRVSLVPLDKLNLLNPQTVKLPV